MIGIKLTPFNFFKMKKRIILIIFLFGFRFLHAQYVLLPDALLNPLVLAFPTSVTNPGSVVFHPTEDLYYTSRCGNISYPLITFSATGVVLNNTNTAVDTRGMWWNPNTNQLERNAFNIIGWSTIDLDVNHFATNLFTTLFTGMHQPDAQSVGSYDPVNNQVLFYSAGTLKRYNRNTALEVSSTPLTGVALTNVNTNSIIYTGVAGYEIGLLDYVAKKVLLFNGSTGVFTGSSQLPATAVTSSAFRFSYANDLVWLYNFSDSKWYSYIIWDITLPVHSLQLSGFQDENVNMLNWEIVADEEIHHFDIEQINNDESISVIGTVDGDNSTDNYYFVHTTPQEGCNYYRVTSTDIYGKQFSSDLICVEFYNKATDYTLYPNPAINNLYISTSGIALKYTILNNSGQILRTGNIDENGALPIAFLTNGVYLIDIEGKVSVFVKQ